MKKLTLLSLLVASPAFAASGPFFSLGNSNFVVLLAFLVFVGILLYAKVPAKLNGMLDNRAEVIRRELEEAKALREEAQTILASYERKQKDVQEQADRIVANARQEAITAANKAKDDLKDAIARRLQAAEEQIASAEAAAIRDVRDRAVTVAIAVAGQVIAKQMTAAEGNALLEDAIAQVDARLH